MSLWFVSILSPVSKAQGIENRISNDRRAMKTDKDDSLKKKNKKHTVII